MNARRHQRPRRVPRVVLLAVLAQLLLGVAWSVLQPPYAGLDEVNHVAGVVQLVYHDTWPAPGALHLTQGVAVTDNRSSRALHANPPQPPQPRGQRPSLAADDGRAQISGISQMSQHPPLYYAALAVLVRVVPGVQGLAWDRLLGLMRLLSAVLLAPLPLLGWAVLRRFTASRPLQVSAALVPLLLPGLARISGSVSNDALLILLGSVVGLGVARIVTGDDSRRTALWTGLATMLALLTKGTALVLPAWLALAYLWCWWRSRRSVLPAALTAAVPTAVGLLWWLRNVVVYGVVQPAGQPLVPGPPGHGLVTFARIFLSGFSYRFWSALGNPEPPTLDRPLTQLATGVVLVLMAVGVLLGRPRDAPRADAAAEPRGGLGGRVAGLVMLFGPVAVLAVVAEGSYAGFRTAGHFIGVQGRYLYPTLGALAVLPLLGLGSVLRGRLRPLAPLVVATFAALLQANGARALLATDWHPHGGSLLHVGIPRLLDWSPWPSALVLAGFAATGLVAAVLGVTLLLEAAAGLRRDPRPA